MAVSAQTYRRALFSFLPLDCVPSQEEGGFSIDSGPPDSVLLAVWSAFFSISSHLSVMTAPFVFYFSATPFSAFVCFYHATCASRFPSSFITSLCGCRRGQSAVDQRGLLSSGQEAGGSPPSLQLAEYLFPQSTQTLLICCSVFKLPRIFVSFEETLLEQKK